MSFRASLIAVAMVCCAAHSYAQEYSDQPLANSRRAGFIRGHFECVSKYTRQFEASSALPADVADAAIEACASWMDDLKKEIPSFEDRDTAVAKIESRARRASIKQTLEARLAAGRK